MGVVAGILGSLGVIAGDAATYAGPIADAIGAGISSMESAGQSYIGSGLGTLGQYLYDATDLIDKYGKAAGGVITLTTDALAKVNQELGGTVLGGFIHDLTYLTNAINSIHDAIVNDIAKPLGPFFNAVTGLTDVVNKDIVSPINKLQLLQKEFEENISEGLKGIVNIPKEMSSTLESLSSDRAKQTTALISGQGKIVEHLLNPGIKSSVHDPLNAIHETYQRYIAEPTVHLSELTPERLSPEPDITGYIEKYKGYLSEVTNGTSWYDQVMKTLITALDVLPYALSYFRYAEKQIDQVMAHGQPIERLPIPDIIQALWRNLLTANEAESEALDQGLDPTRLNVLYEISRALLTPGETLQAYYRGIINEQDFIAEMEKINYDESRIKVLTELYTVLPKPADAIEWWARSGLAEIDLDKILEQNGFTADQIKMIKSAAVSPINPISFIRTKPLLDVRDKGFLSEVLTQNAPEDVQQYYLENLVTLNQANVDWVKHWKLPSVGDWSQAYFRGLITKEDLSLGYQANAVPESIEDVVLGLERELIPIWLVPEILATGTISTEQATDMLAKLGIDQNNIDIILTYADAKSKSSLVAQTDALAQLSLSNLKDMYDDGILTDSQYLDGLKEHGYLTESATLLVNLEKTKLKLKQRTTIADGIVADVNHGTLTLGAAQDKLYSLGYTDAEVNKYLDKVTEYKRANTKMPSKTELKDMVTAGIIGYTEWASAMELLGYTDYWISAYAALWGIKV